MFIQRSVQACSVLTFALVLGCGGEEAARDEHQPPPATAENSGGPLTPDPGGKVITIELTTDAAGVNKFSPSEFEAHQGDVLRFTLGTGVHNVHFDPAENPAGVNLPPASPMLQLPGQTYDVKVSWKEGKYKFMCDPHALLGMRGEVEVEDDD